MAEEPIEVASTVPVEKKVATSPMYPGTFGPIPQMDNGMTFKEIGNSGLRQWSGYVREEFLPELAGRQGVRSYREMMDNSPVVGGIIQAIVSTMRKVEWRTEPPEEDGPEDSEAIDFADSLRLDMSETWEDTIVEALSMVGYGFAPMEIVYKRRKGPNPGGDRPASKYTDGKIGWRRLPLRGQDTLLKWFFGENGQIEGLTQQPWNGPIIDIPIEKMLLFRPTQHKNNPEGRSVLRNAYRSYYFTKRIEEQEAILYERLNGIPVVRLPISVMNAAAAGDAAAVVLVNNMKKIAVNLRIDEQMGLVLPSDPWQPPGGTGTSAFRQYDLELVTPTGGGRMTVNATETLNRHNVNIMISVLADFLQMGHEVRGTQGLAGVKTDMFFQAIEGYLNSMASVFNRYGLVRVWKLNGMDPATRPNYTPDLAQRVDLDVISNFVQRLAQAGMPLFPNEELQTALLDSAGLPDVQDVDAESLQEMTARVGAENAPEPAPGAADTPFGKMVLASMARRFQKLNTASTGRSTRNGRSPFVAKFNPNHDELGRFTYGSDVGRSPTTFVSPNIGEMTFDQAVGALDGERQKALLAASKEIDKELGIASEQEAAIGAWQDGAENSLMVLMPGATEEQALVASAMKGALANQKAVLVFTPAEGGEAYIATFNATGGLSEIHDSLLSAGLAFHTLAPTASGAQVIVYGSDQATIDAIDVAAGASNVSIVKGSGTFLGTSLSTGSDAEQRADAQSVYRATIEGAGTVAGRNAAAVWDSVSDHWSATLQALTKALARFFKFNPNHDTLGRFSDGAGGGYAMSSDDFRAMISRSRREREAMERDIAGAIEADGIYVARGGDRAVTIAGSPREAGLYQITNFYRGEATGHIESQPKNLGSEAMQMMGRGFQQVSGDAAEAALDPASYVTKFNPNHDEIGRFTFGRGIKAVGEQMAAMVKDLWVLQSDIDTITELTEAAPEDQDKLAKDAAEINAKVDHGSELVDPGVKSEGRIIEKVEAGREPAAVTDAVRLGFIVPEPGLADQIVDSLAQRYAVADEGWVTTPAGYIDRKVLIRFSDGMIGEVQMWPPTMYAAKMPGGGEALYAKARTLPAGDPVKAQLVAEMRTLYGRAQVTLPASWKSVIGM